MMPSGPRTYMMGRMPSVFTGVFFGSALTAVGVWNFAVRAGHGCVHPAYLDWRLALELHSNFDKERQ
jgi:hypothetical protein